MNPVEILEIGEPAVSGVTSRPFRCMGDDDNCYYVKLGNALPDERVCEWIFTHLAREMGLPTAECRIVHLAKELSQKSAWDTTEFGHGLGFGSLSVESAEDFQPGDVQDVSHPLQAATLLFDWWVLNEDRKLGKAGGNPNLLMSVNKECVLIDFGNSMDADFDEIAFFEDHAFGASKQYWAVPEHRKEWSDLALAAMRRLDAIWNQVPAEWETPNLQLDGIKNLLDRVASKSKEFWKPFVQ